MDHKTRFDVYPGFSVFVDFVQRLAQDVRQAAHGSFIVHRSAFIVQRRKVKTYPVTRHVTPGP